MSDKRANRNYIEETISELYLVGVLVITEAGVRLTYPFLKAFMMNPQNVLTKVEENSRVENNSSLAKDIVESVSYLLVGSKERKWLSVEEIIGELERKGYTITTIGSEERQDDIRQA